MVDKLKKILSSIDADYADVRYEIKKDIVITFNGKELSQIGSNSTDGYVVRALKDGGFATAVFTKEADADKIAKTVVENAKLIGKNKKKPVTLAKSDVVKETFMPTLKEDPRKISIEEKLEITRKANEVPLSHKEIATTNVAYRELIREKTFVSSEDSEIREDLVTLSLAGEIIAKDGNLVQNVRVATGGSDGFHTIRNPEKNFEERTQIAINLLKAKPVLGGVYNCILNPSIAGVFTHEAFGHFSEADIIENLPAMREKMKLGSKLGNDVLNIVDNATMPNQLGFYKYDDEGVKVRHTQLMKNGVLVGRLHSRRTAAEFNEPISGHCVAEDFRYAPIIRMGNIFIEPGAKTLDELFALLGDGLYILDAKGGQTAGENFTFGAQYGYIVKNGKKAEMIRDINISGNLYKTLY
jgi:TldD protein